MSHLYFLGAVGFGFPQFEQNFEVLVEPHSQVQLRSAAAAGVDPPFFAPQLEQKLVVFSAPQLGHFQLAGGAGFFVPQLEQKLVVLLVPQEGQVQPPAVGAAPPWGPIGC